MPTSLTPYFHIGATPAQSSSNLYSWLDNVAGQLAGPQCLVYTLTGNREKGLFHHMRSDLHAMFESELSGHSTWFIQCSQTTYQQAGIILWNPGGWVHYLWHRKNWDRSLIKSELLLMCYYTCSHVYFFYTSQGFIFVHLLEP